MPDIVHRITSSADPSTVYAALTTQEGLAGWWTIHAHAEPREGALLQFRFPDDGPDMKVVELEPNKRVAWECIAGPPEWVGTELTFDLRQEESETVILFAHRKWKEEVEFMAHCSCKWAQFLMSLKSLVESGRGAPFPRDTRLGSWG